MILVKLEQTLFFLTILFLPTQLGRHFWPDFSYIYSLRIDYLSPTVYFWDLLVTGLLTVWILKDMKINWLALNLLLAFLFTQMVSLMGTDNSGAGLVRLEQYLVAGLFGVYLASSKYQVLSIKLYWPLALAVVFESGLSIAQFLKAGTLGFWILGERTFTITTPGIAKFNFYGLEFLRPYATFPHPNVLAAFMVITCLIMSSLSRIKIFIWVLGAVTILLTVSRAAILGGLVSSFLLLQKKGRLLLLLGIFMISPILYTRFAAVFNFDNLTLIRREQLSEVAWQIFLSSPILGVGLNNFIPAVSDQLLSGPSRFLQPVHNIFLLALAETGILGLLGLLGLIGYPVLKLIKGKGVRDKARFAKRGKVLVLAWVVIVFLGIFDHYFLTLPQGYRLLFLVWGLSLSMLELKNEDPR